MPRPTQLTGFSFSIISVTVDGDQQTASGFTTYREVDDHLGMRLRSVTQYDHFVIVTTSLFAGDPVTVVDNLKPNEVREHIGGKAWHLKLVTP